MAELAAVSDLEVVLRLLAAVAFGAVIGFERELAEQSAGLRTHVLVALGAGVFTLVGASVAGTDPTRVAAQVVSGIGFLGAAAVIREGLTIHGLTTAASLWVTAALGLAAGLGRFTAALTAAGLGVLVLWALKRMERTLLPSRRGPSISVEVDPGAALTDTVQLMHGVVDGFTVSQMDAMTADRVRIELKVQPRKDLNVAKIVEGLGAIPGVLGVSLRR